MTTDPIRMPGPPIYRQACIACIICALLLLNAGDTALAGKTMPPGEVLRRASAAYRALGSFRGTMTMTVTLPGQDAVERTIHYGAGRDGVFIDAGFQRIVAANRRIIVTQVDIDDKYVSAPYEDDFAASLAAIGGDQLQIPDLPPIVFYQSREQAAWIDAFRLRILAPLTLAKETAVTTADGRRVYELTMTAENGSLSAGFEAESGLLIFLDVEATPPGAPPSMIARASCRFASESLGSLGDLLAFDPGDRAAVMDMAALTADAIEVGAEVPMVTLESIRGKRVNLGDLRGRVVVLDFWASWCAPCWKALDGLEDFVVWAERSELPVSVWAVNTAEGLEDLTAQREKASRLWKERGFSMDSLVDVGGDLFTAIGAPGLPTTLVIAPDGTLALFHLGVLNDTQATLRGEIERLLRSRD